MIAQEVPNIQSIRLLMKRAPKKIQMMDPTQILETPIRNGRVAGYPVYGRPMLISSLTAQELGDIVADLAAEGDEYIRVYSSYHDADTKLDAVDIATFKENGQFSPLWTIALIPDDQKDERFERFRSRWIHMYNPRRTSKL